MWNMHDAGWGWWLMSTVLMVGFWAAVIYGVFWLARNSAAQRERSEDREPPDAVLRRRLAAGEISVEEYERVRHALSGERRGEPSEPALR